MFRLEKKVRRVKKTSTHVKKLESPVIFE